MFQRDATKLLLELKPVMANLIVLFCLLYTTVIFISFESLVVSWQFFCLISFHPPPLQTPNNNKEIHVLGDLYPAVFLLLLSTKTKIELTFVLDELGSGFYVCCFYFPALLISDGVKIAS